MSKNRRTNQRSSDQRKKTHMDIEIKTKTYESIESDLWTCNYIHNVYNRYVLIPDILKPCSKLSFSYVTWGINRILCWRRKMNDLFANMQAGNNETTKEHITNLHWLLPLYWLTDCSSQNSSWADTTRSHTYLYIFIIQLYRKGESRERVTTSCLIRLTNSNSYLFAINRTIEQSTNQSINQSIDYSSRMVSVRSLVLASALACTGSAFAPPVTTPRSQR